MEVLLVENNATDFLIAKTMLGRSISYRYEVRHVSNLSDASEEVLSSPPDVVLLDLGLPDSTGVDTAREFVEALLVSTVVLTGDYDEATGREVFRLGAQDILRKGENDLSVLEHTIASSIERYRAERQRKEDITELIDANLDQARAARELLRLNNSLGSEIRFRERVPKELEQSEARFKTIFEEAPVALWELDLSHVKLALDKMNEGLEDLEGYLREHDDEVRRLTSMVVPIDVGNGCTRLFGSSSKEELIERFMDIFTARSFKDLAGSFAALGSGEHRFEFEYLFRTLGNEPLELLIRWSVLPGREKDLSRVLLSTIDITQIRQSERQRRLLATAIEQSIETVIVSNEDGTIQYANPAFETISGWSAKEAVSRGLHFLHGLADEEQMKEEIHATIERGRVWSGRLRGFAKDGRTTEEEATMTRGWASRRGFAIGSSIRSSRRRRLERDRGKAWPSPTRRWWTSTRARSSWIHERGKGPPSPSGFPYPRRTRPLPTEGRGPDGTRQGQPLHPLRR